MPRRMATDEDNRGSKAGEVRAQAEVAERAGKDVGGRRERGPRGSCGMLH